MVSWQFIRDDLKHERAQIDQANLHGNDDLITVHDLWLLWVHSEGKIFSFVLSGLKYGSLC